LWTAYDDHRDVVHCQGTEGLHRLPNEIFPDRGTTDGHEDRLLPEEQVFPKLFSGRTERADDRLDPSDVRPRWGIIEGEDQIDLSRESGEPKVPVPLEQAGGRVRRKGVAQSVEDDRRGNSVADGLPHGGDFAGGEEESIRLPIALSPQILPSDAQIPRIVDIPSPDRQQSTFDRGTCGPRKVPVPPGGVRLHPGGARDPRGVAIRARVCACTGYRTGPRGRGAGERPGRETGGDRTGRSALPTPRIPGRADPRLGPRGHIPDPALRAPGSDRRGITLGTRLGRYGPPYRGPAPDGPAPRGRRFPNALLRLPPVHERDA